MPDLLGSTLGQYRVEERLGSGGVGVVYRAVQKPTDQQVALKVLDPGLTARPGFMRRFVSQAATISKLGHPGIVPVYEIGTRAQLTYLSMRLVHGGTLKDLLVEGTVDLGAVWRILRSIADALHSAHEAGVVHQDLKPSNVLLERDGSIMLTDFGLARINYGYALGTPGYMSPEQAMGLEVDRRSDVHALGLLAFELLTGHRPFMASSPVDLILATVYDPVPSARALNPELPTELDSVLFRALAKNPAERQNSVFALLEELSQLPMTNRPAITRRPAAGIASNGNAASPGQPGATENWGANLQLLTLFEASLDAVVAIDEGGLITHWNSQAEAMLGWSRKQIMGLPALTTFIAPRYREVLERIFATFLAVHEGPQEGQAVEVAAIHRDGHQIPLELSLSLVQLQPGKWNLVAFCRDISARKEAERLRAMQDAATDVLSDTDDPQELFRRLLEAVCVNLDWSAGAIWMLEPGGRQLRCREFWQGPSLDSPQLASLSRKTTYEKGAGVPGRVWASQEPVWHSDLVRVAESARELAALRAGLQAIGAFPIQDGSRVLGVLEIFSSSAGELTNTRFSKVESIARRLGRQLGRVTPSRAQPIPEHAAPETPSAPVAVAARRSVRYRIDARHSRIGFSCAFMKFLTVHGHFNDFSGWVEVENDEPKTARAQCVVKTASVDTGSLDRDYHICSRDFFAVESYPDMVFESTGVERRGDERFRLIGDLTIRNTSRPIRLDVRLEERETDSSGNEKATLSASTVISRQDWFLDWQEALEAGRWIVGDQIKLDLEIALSYRPEGAAV
jgi:PAS domain S-box-containing protein